MAIDFPSAAARHLRDAASLLAASPANARYLAGYCAECAMKSVIECGGIKARVYGHRLLDLRGEGMELAASMAPALTRYRPTQADVQIVRDNWSETHRYLATADTPAGVAAAVLGAAGRAYRATVGEMFLDGVFEELPQ